MGRNEINKMKDIISEKNIAKFNKNYTKSKKNDVVRHALTKTPLSDIAYNLDSYYSSDFNFSVDIKTLPVCNQKRSGRCWIFSASTVLREIIAKKLDIKGNFEISQNHIAFYDKLEKFNYYMENLIQLCLAGEAHDSRKVYFLLSTGVGDGGQWDMYTALVKKYGIVPKAVFDETEQSSSTMLSTKLLNSNMRKFASEIYAMKKDKKGLEEMEDLKEEYMEKVYSLLCSCFGIPVTKFDYEYTNNKGEHVHLKDMTPKSFFDAYVGEEIDEYVSLINAPTKDKKFYQTYNIDLVGNVLGAKPITHLNVPMDRMEELIIKQLKAGKVVWFGSDVSYYGDRIKGIWDDNLFDYKSMFDMEFKFDKEQMLDFHNSVMNHAMVLTGVNLIDDKPTKWKVENSWGKENGFQGYYTMSESWFESFVYQAAIKKKYLNKKELSALEKEPVLLPPWDPFGTLAD